MKPAIFPQHTGTLSGGPAIKYGTAEDVGDLPVCRSGSEIISCWSLTWWERMRVLFTGKIWLLVLAPRTHAPVCLMTESPFEGGS